MRPPSLTNNHWSHSIDWDINSWWSKFKPNLDRIEFQEYYIKRAEYIPDCWECLIIQLRILFYLIRSE